MVVDSSVLNSNSNNCTAVYVSGANGGGGGGDDGGGGDGTFVSIKGFVTLPLYPILKVIVSAILKLGSVFLVKVKLTFSPSPSVYNRMSKYFLPTYCPIGIDSGEFCVPQTSEPQKAVSMPDTWLTPSTITSATNNIDSRNMLNVGGGWGGEGGDGG